MDKILSIRKNYQLFALFFKIQEYLKSENRTDIVNAAIQMALEERKKGGLNWNTIAAARLPSLQMEQSDVPDFIQLRVDENKYKEIVGQIMEDFFLEKASPTPFVIKLLLRYYLIFLEGNGVEITKPQKSFPEGKEELMGAFRTLPIEEKLNKIYELLLHL